MIEDPAREFHGSVDTKMLAWFGEAELRPAGGRQQRVSNQIFVESDHALMRTYKEH